MLCSIELPIHSVLASINNFIDNYKYGQARVKAKQIVWLELSECQWESLIFHFLYTYMIHNLQWYFKTEDYVVIYRHLAKFFKNFVYSRHPSTILWLLEILNIFSNKFVPIDAYWVDKGLKNEFVELTNTIVLNATLILSGDLRVEFEKDYSLVFCLPPSVHEYVKSFELASKQEDGIRLTEILKEGSGN